MAEIDRRPNAFVNQFIIQPEEIILGDKLGEGAFGVVYAAEVRASHVACKVPKKNFLSKTQHEEFVREVEIMSKIFHTNVCLFLGACTTNGNIRIVTEKCAGDLHGLIMGKDGKQQEIPLSKRLRYGLEAARGVAWLHGNTPQVLHRDLKLANLLFDENHVVKVADFGLSQLQEQEETHDIRPKGSPLYMGPEVLLNQAITAKVDVYAFGLVLWEMISRVRAFEGHKSYNVFKHAVTVKLERPPIPDTWHPELRELCTACWEPDPSKRPTMVEVVHTLERLIPIFEQLELAEAVDAAIPEPSGAAFWKEHFLGRESAPWSLVRELLFRQFGLPVPVDPYERPLPDSPTEEQLSCAAKYQLEEFLNNKRGSPEARAAVAEALAQLVEAEGAHSYGTSLQPIQWSDESYASYCAAIAKWLFLYQSNFQPHLPGDVTLARFASIVTRFGPVERDMLVRMASLVGEPYFFGDLSATDSERMLSKVAGAYLVRFSSRPGQFTISKVVKGGKKLHVNVVYRPATRDFTVGENEYPTMAAVIAARPELTTPQPESHYHVFQSDRPASLEF